MEGESFKQKVREGEGRKGGRAPASEIEAEAVVNVVVI